MKTPKYNINLYLTNKGWQISHDYEKMSDEPVRLQRDFYNVVSTLSEKMSARSSEVAQFKIKLSFMKSDTKNFYRLSIYCKQSRLCPAKYSQMGMELYSIINEWLFSKDSHKK